MVYCYILAAVALLYIFFDVNYFLRVLFTIGIARNFRKKVGVLDETSIYGLCTTNDIDVFINHMNNARYIRELDFARFDYYVRSDLYKEIFRRGGNALQGASSVRYRRSIPIFTPYKITTKVVYWDDKAIYLEQKFVTLSDDFIRTIVFSKQNIVNVDAKELMEAVAGKKELEVPEELSKWIESNQISSERLRKSD